MKQEERQKAILDYLRQKKTASYEEIESLFDVSNMTIRRDVVRLAETGKVIKTVGGAQVAGMSAELYESEILSRLSVNSPEKRVISQQALEYIQPQDVIYIDGSSTCLELAKRIAEVDLPLTVVTNSLLVYMELAGCKNVTLVCLGGQHDPVSYCLTGPQTEAQAGNYFVNKAFFSTKGFSPEEGTFESSMANFRIKQAIAPKSSEIILLLDHTKFGQKGLYKVFDISQIHTVFTDSLVAPGDRTVLEGKVKQVIICPLRDENAIAG